MTKSNFQTLMLPLLESLKTGEARSVDYIKDELIRFVELTDKELKTFDLDKDQGVFQQAIALATEHLTTAGLIENTGREGLRITSFGKLVLSKRLNSLDIEYLRRLPGYNR